MSEEIELTEEDERILDEVWAKFARGELDNPVEEYEEDVNGTELLQERV